jgi:hypothetical protein
VALPAVTCTARRHVALQISETSKELGRALRSSGGDRFEEMYAEGLLRQKHRTALEFNKAETDATPNELVECTFRPSITPWPSMSDASKLSVRA